MTDPTSPDMSVEQLKHDTLAQMIKVQSGLALADMVTSLRETQALRLAAISGLFQDFPNMSLSDKLMVLERMGQTTDPTSSLANLLNTLDGLKAAK